MWSLKDCKIAFVAVGVISIIICFVPIGMELLGTPHGEAFSELYILGPDHSTGDYPFNVSISGSNYSSGYTVYLGVENHIGSSSYYQLDVKFRNASESLPNGNLSSSLPALYTYRVFLGDGQTWEGALTFSFLDVNITQNTNFVGSIRINNAVFEIDKPESWDNGTSGYYYQLMVELWRYNQTSNGLLYDSRFVSLWLNMTRSS